MLRDNQKLKWNGILEQLFAAEGIYCDGIIFRELIQERRAAFRRRALVR
jgi:hypothetical protein